MLKRIVAGIGLALLSLCVLGAQVNLAWNASTSSTAVGYKLHAGTASGAYSMHTDVGPALTGSMPGLDAGTKYYFAVTAYNSSGAESGYSNEVSATTLAQASLPPVAPASFFAQDGAGGETLTWDLSPGATKYNIYKSTAAGQKGALLGSVTAPPATDCNMTPGVRYYWTATAVNASGESTDSVQDYGTALAGTCSGDSFGFVSAPPPPVTVPAPTAIMPSGSNLITATVGTVDSAQMSIDGGAPIDCTIAGGVASCSYLSVAFDLGASTRTFTVTSTKSGATASASAKFQIPVLACSTAAGVKNGVDVYTVGCKRTWTRM